MQTKRKYGNLDVGMNYYSLGSNFPNKYVMGKAIRLTR